MSVEFDVEEAINSIVETEATDNDDRSETVFDVTELISPSWYSCHFWISCLQMMTSRNIAVYRYDGISMTV